LSHSGSSGKDFLDHISTTKKKVTEEKK
jgi:hypothetical protein